MNREKYTRIYSGGEKEAAGDIQHILPLRVLCTPSDTPPCPSGLLLECRRQMPLSSPLALHLADPVISSNVADHKVYMYSPGER